MGFIDKSVSFSIVLLINCILSVKSDNCQPLIDLITTNKLYILNASEIVVFFPIDFKFTQPDFSAVCSSGNCITTNEVSYKNIQLTSLSHTDLEICDEIMHQKKYLYDLLDSVRSLFQNLKSGL
ncbi:uncharacterized protein LOC113556075 [Rhopalosiphum maidis]|uniref:uncharacterized protein LOC113556075 n=1 Tax=Rhopalosiphum maidis TaxID=43146 RepID=UPI000EFE9C16|nr:uncharacterized protein LOC113556075 [Rhopalosiphum maidis]